MGVLSRPAGGRDMALAGMPAAGSPLTRYGRVPPVVRPAAPPAQRRPAYDPAMGAQVHLCGRLRVEWDGERLEQGLPGRQGRLLFAFLTLHRDRPVRRDELVEALWSEETPPASGEALLRPPLSRLRRALGPDRLEGRGELEVRFPADTWIDREAVGDGARLGRASLAAGDARGSWDAARDALAIAERGLLPGLEVRWLEPFRTELEEQRVELLELVALAGAQLGDGDLSEAEQAARRAVETAPFRESARVALLEVLRARGNVAEALVAFDEFRVFLRDELGTSPGRALLDLHEALLHAEPGARPAAARPPAPARAERADRLPDRLAQALAAPWVGRGAALARLRREADEAAAGRAALVLVAGEGGIGKTRLVAELAAGLDGFQVLYGRCDEEEIFPYGPWVDMLRPLLARRSDAELAALAGPEAGELARLLPELRDRLPDLAGDAHAADPETERRRLFVAVQRLVARLAQEAPLLVVVDDMHWADRSSLLLGRHLAREPRLGPVLLVGTYRDTELDPGHPLPDLIADVERDRPVPRVRLAGMDEHEVAALVGASPGARLEGDAVRAIRADTDGTRSSSSSSCATSRRSAATRASPRRARERARRDRPAGGAAARARGPGPARRRADRPRLRATTCSSAWSTSPRTSCSTCSTPRSAARCSWRSPARPAATRSRTRCCARPWSPSSRRRGARGCTAGSARRSSSATTAGSTHGSTSSRATSPPPGRSRSTAPSTTPSAPPPGRRAGSPTTRPCGCSPGRGAAPRRRPGRRGRPRAARARAGHRRGRRGPVEHGARELRPRGRPPRAPEGPARRSRAPRSAMPAAAGTCTAWRTRRASRCSRRRSSACRRGTRGCAPRCSRGWPCSATSRRRPRGRRCSAPPTRRSAIARRLDDPEALVPALIAAQWARWRPGRAEERLPIADEQIALSDARGARLWAAEAHLWRLGALLELCRLDEAEQHIARHAEIAEEPQQYQHLLLRDALRAMRALLAGDYAAGAAAAEEMLEWGARAEAHGSEPVPMLSQNYGVQMVAILNERDELGALVPQAEQMVREIGALPGWRAVLAWAYVQAGRAGDARGSWRRSARTGSPPCRATPTSSRRWRWSPMRPGSSVTPGSRPRPSR